MTRTEITLEFVTLAPPVLEPGVLYISMEYATVLHLCCCGCGNQVVTPLAPARWRLTYDGRAVSLSPSIGNHSFPCRSHYWILALRVGLSVFGERQKRTTELSHFANVYTKISLFC